MLKLNNIVERKKAIILGYCNRDCETHYECPVCNKKFGSWDIFHNSKNENGNKEYCPYCNTELDGLK